MDITKEKVLEVIQHGPCTFEQLYSRFPVGEDKLNELLSTLYDENKINDMSFDGTISLKENQRSGEASSSGNQRNDVHHVQSRVTRKIVKSTAEASRSDNQRNDVHHVQNRVTRKIVKSKANNLSKYEKILLAAIKPYEDQTQFKSQTFNELYDVVRHNPELWDKCIRIDDHAKKKRILNSVLKNTAIELNLDTETSDYEGCKALHKECEMRNKDDIQCNDLDLFTLIQCKRIRGTEFHCPIHRNLLLFLIYRMKCVSVFECPVLEKIQRDRNESKYIDFMDTQLDVNAKNACKSEYMKFLACHLVFIFQKTDPAFISTILQKFNLKECDLDPNVVGKILDSASKVNCEPKQCVAIDLTTGERCTEDARNDVSNETCRCYKHQYLLTIVKGFGRILSLTDTGSLFSYFDEDVIKAVFTNFVDNYQKPQQILSLPYCLKRYIALYCRYECMKMLKFLPDQTNYTIDEMLKKFGLNGETKHAEGASSASK